jgi:hypothetical protein
VEDVYASVATVADSKLHLVFMQDDVPGIYIPGSPSVSSNPVNTDTMIYEEISTTDILSDKVGLINLGVNNAYVNNLFNVSSVYPNPAKDQLSIELNLRDNSPVAVKVYNMLGQEIVSRNYGMTPTGNNILQLDMNSVPPGMYLCNITAGAYTLTKNIVIQR